MHTVRPRSQTDFSMDKRPGNGMHLCYIIVVRTRQFDDTTVFDLGQAIFWAPVDILSSSSEPERQSRPGDRSLAVDVVDREVILYNDQVSCPVCSTREGSIHEPRREIHCSTTNPLGSLMSLPNVSQHNLLDNRDKRELTKDSQQAYPRPIPLNTRVLCPANTHPVLQSTSA